MDVNLLDLKDIIVNLGKADMTGGTIVKLFFMQNKICRLGKYFGRKEGNDFSSRLAPNTSSLVKLVKADDKADAEFVAEKAADDSWNTWKSFDNANMVYTSFISVCISVVSLVTSLVSLIATVIIK